MENIATLWMLFAIPYVSFFVFCCIRIAQKAGYARWFGAVVVIPIVNLVVLGYMAFEAWPIFKPSWEVAAEKSEKRLAKLEQKIARLKAQAEGIYAEPAHKTIN